MSSQTTMAGAQSGSSVRATDTEASGDVRDVVAHLRSSVVSLTAGAYVVAMVGVIGVATVAVGVDVGLRVAVVLAAGAVGTMLAVRLMERVLGEFDELGRRSIELTDLYDQARHESLRDGLTGLGNHRAFQEELDRAVQMSRRHGQPTALLLLDVDDLKRMNDADGHEAGDEALQSVGRIVISNLRRIDRAFRIGGDEFAVLSPGTSAQGALALGRRILVAALEGEQQLGQRPISLTIGISAVPELSADRTLLYRHADAALYWGKRHGRTDIQVYDPSLHGVADDDRPTEELVTAIDRIVSEHLLRPVFQPVFSLADGACLGFEGLVRPIPDSGFRNAGALFGAAESVSRTVELDIAAVRQIAAGARDLGPQHYLAINLSPRTLEAEAFNPHELLTILARAGLDQTRLVVELTEREAVEDMEQLNRALQALRRTGVRVAADDVGAGNAGLQLLSRVDFDIIKLDMSLVRTGAFLATSQAVLRAVIEMAGRRGATTVAEGIETPSQLYALQQLGIAVGQGYLLGTPRERPEADDLDLDALLARADPALDAASSASAVAA